MLAVTALLSAAAVERPLQQIPLPNAHPCVRLLHLNGTIGCGTPRSGSIAPLVTLLDEASVSALAVGGLRGARLSVALAPRLFTLPTLRHLQRMLGDRLAGVAVLHRDRLHGAGLHGLDGAGLHGLDGEGRASSPPSTGLSEAEGAGTRDGENRDGASGGVSSRTSPRLSPHLSSLSRASFPFGIALLDRNDSEVGDAPPRSTPP